jgi:hypothetical protein
MTIEPDDASHDYLARLAAGRSGEKFARRGVFLTSPRARGEVGVRA